jgi:large subunit ribosomal protein L20
MPRSKNAVASRARRKKILDQAKGYYGKRKNVYTVAKNIVEKGMTYSYVGRKLKKREYRTLWIARINAAVREEGLTYSEFIHALSVKGIDINRKVLADLAMNEPASFKALILSVKG